MGKKENSSFIFDDFIYDSNGVTTPLPRPSTRRDIDYFKREITKEIINLGKTRNPSTVISRAFRIIDLTKELIFVLNGYKVEEGIPDFLYRNGSIIIENNQNYHDDDQVLIDLDFDVDVDDSSLD
jgi:hypothetical protein